MSAIAKVHDFFN